MSVTKRSGLWLLLLTIVFSLLVPAVGLADQGRGRGRERKSEKFINGHDARDGRWDGRGPRRNVSRNRYPVQTRRDRDYGRRNDTAEIRRRAINAGYREGHNAGRRDRYDGRRSNARRAFRQASFGYSYGYGDSRLYRRSFEEGFRAGYRDGYNQGGRRGIFGGIFGR